MTVSPTIEEWGRFRAAVGAGGVRTWEAGHVDEHVLDGTAWSIGLERLTGRPWR